MIGRHRGGLFWLGVLVSFWAAVGTTLAAGPQSASTSQNAVEQARKDSRATVISLALEIDPSVRKDDDLFKRCSSWELSREDARFFFANAERITGEQRHHGYDSLPCNYRGVMEHEGRIFEFTINAGSHGYMEEAGSSADGKGLSFGCIEKCARLFPFDLY